MSGPEHYREAERLLGHTGSERILAAAQVHATLALAAATARSVIVGSGLETADAREWLAVLI